MSTREMAWYLVPATVNYLRLGDSRLLLARSHSATNLMDAPWPASYLAPQTRGLPRGKDAILKVQQLTLVRKSVVHIHTTVWNIWLPWLRFNNCLTGQNCATFSVWYRSRMFTLKLYKTWIKSLKPRMFTFPPHCLALSSARQVSSCTRHRRRWLSPWCSWSWSAWACLNNAPTVCCPALEPGGDGLDRPVVLPHQRGRHLAPALRQTSQRVTNVQVSVTMWPIYTWPWI